MCTLWETPLCPIPVPFARVQSPGEKAGQRVGGFVRIPDYVPTLLGRLELEPVPRVTGKDFWPLVSGETRSVHDYAVMAYGWIGSVRTPEWNFSAVWNPKEYTGNYPPQLYNRGKDPDELTDVAGKYPDVVADLKQKLDDYIEAGRGLTRGSFHARRGVGTPTY